jgi:hypothetical protein
MQESHATAIASQVPQGNNHLEFNRGREVLSETAFISRKGLNLRSRLRIWTGALTTGVVVFFFALALQWTIYDRYLHENGIRVVGSAIASIIAIGVFVSLGMAARRARQQEIQRLETIALLNHHIRNALQAIVTCSGSTDSTDIIRGSVERIEWALGEVLPDVNSRRFKPDPTNHS